MDRHYVTTGKYPGKVWIMVDPGVRKPVWNVDVGYSVDKDTALETRKQGIPGSIHLIRGFFYLQCACETPALRAQIKSSSPT